MRDFKDLLNTARKIEEITDDIISLRASYTSPKNQIITGMPRGNSPENALDRYLIKIDRLEKRREGLIKYQVKQWHTLNKKLVRIATEQEITLMYFRFAKGYTWQKAVDELNNECKCDWGINKAFRIYGKINRKLQKIS